MSYWTSSALSCSCRSPNNLAVWESRSMLGIKRIHCCFSRSVKFVIFIRILLWMKTLFWQLSTQGASPFRKGEVCCESNERWVSISSACDDKIPVDHERAVWRGGSSSPESYDNEIYWCGFIWRREFWNVAARGEAGWCTQEEPVLLTNKWCV